ncbi:hypothetical protein V1478_009831 [Vespula squamosa]|uniref:Uncharacterized protein n=1 Tax=Vespula squamosa TaxID=30214 RepID=A0ABD2AM98_VESSQ
MEKQKDKRIREDGRMETTGPWIRGDYREFEGWVEARTHDAASWQLSHQPLMNELARSPTLALPTPLTN